MEWKTSARWGILAQFVPRSSLGRCASRLLYADSPRDALASGLNNRRQTADSGYAPAVRTVGDDGHVFDSSRPEARSPTNHRRTTTPPTTMNGCPRPRRRASDALPRLPRPRRPRTTTTSASTIDGLAGAAPPVEPDDRRAPTPTPRTPKPDPDTFAALANEVAENEALLTQLSAQTAQATQRLGDLDDRDHDDPAAARGDPRPTSKRLRQVVRDRAAYIYRHADTPSTAVLDIHTSRTSSSGASSTRSQPPSATRRKIGDSHAVLDNSTPSASSSDSAAQPAAGAAGPTRIRPRHALETLTAHQKKLLDEAGTITVMGDSELTGARDHDVVRGPHGAAPPVERRYDDRRARPDLYVEEGAAEHVPAELAFAQSILETGSFGHATDNNYGGIGACDSCNGEIRRSRRPATVYAARSRC